MTRCSCGVRPEPGERWCGTCGRRLDADRQPAVITVTQVLLVLSAIVATVGLLLVAAVASALSPVVEALSALGGTGVPAVAGQGVSLVLASVGVAAIVVVAVDSWAFVALGRGRTSARWALTALAVIDAAATTAMLIAAGTPALAVLIVVLIGLLVFDVPIVVLLWGPEASRRWLSPPTRAAAPAPAADAAPDPAADAPPDPARDDLTDPAPTADAPPRPRLVALTTTGAIRVPQPRPAGDDEGSDERTDDEGRKAEGPDDPDADDPVTDRFALRLLTPVPSGRHSAPDS